MFPAGNITTEVKSFEKVFFKEFVKILKAGSKKFPIHDVS